MTQAIILAAGQGTRCKPLTSHLPKCLLSFAGATLLEHQERVLKKNGIAHITVIGGYLNHLITEKGYNCVVNEQYRNSNMVHSLFYASDILASGETIVIAYGDIIYQSDNLAQLLDAPGDFVLMSDAGWYDYWSMRFANVFSDAESFVLDSKNNLIEIGQAVSDLSRIHGQFTGLFKISASAAAQLSEVYQDLLKNCNDKATVMNMYMTDFIQHLIDLNWTITATQVQRGWLEFDSVKDMNIYQKLMLDNQLNEQFHLGQ